MRGPHGGEPYSRGQMDLGVYPHPVLSMSPQCTPNLGSLLLPSPHVGSEILAEVREGRHSWVSGFFGLCLSSEWTRGALRTR